MARGAPGSEGRKRAFVIGGGVAGLAAATALAQRGAEVALFEAGPQAGGRCRSYFDSAFGGTIDNGNHFVLTGNKAVFRYLDRIGARAALQGAARPEKDFFDLASGRRWTIRPNPGRLPFWLLNAHRNVPGATAGEYLELAKLLLARPDQRISDVLSCKGALWDRLMRPFFLGALNTQPEEASARLAAALVRKTFLKGGNAYRTRIAHPTLAAAFVDPALAFLEGRGAKVQLGQRLRRFTTAGTGVRALEFADATIPTGMKDAIVLAVTAPVAQDLVPGLTAPNEFRAIVNAHFKFTPPPGASPMLGVIGGTAEWIFTFADRISVTVSGADAIVDRDRLDLAGTLWAEVCAALAISADLPPWQIVKEKRATFAATPGQDGLRPGPRTPTRNLFLAGDWTQTGLPATLEGAIQSGERAAGLAARHLHL